MLRQTCEVTIFNRRIRKIGPGSTMCVNPLITHYCRTCVKKLSSFGLELVEEAFRVTGHNKN